MIATQFWLDSQCFEKFVIDLKQSFDPNSQFAIVSKPLAAKLVTELISDIKILVAACENGSSTDEFGSDSATVGRASTAASDSLNHKAYKTIILFQSQALLFIFEFIHHAFTS